MTKEWDKKFSLREENVLVNYNLILTERNILFL